MTYSKEIVLCYIPSHIGFTGNDEADTTAKFAQNESHDNNITIHYTNLKCKINRCIQHKWQNRWTNKTNNKLLTSNRILGRWKQMSSEREEKTN